jgi:hypothetical protein
MIRAARKIAYEIRGPRREKAKKPEEKVYRAFITLEDQVGIRHLQHRVGKREEFQTTLQHPHQFRKSLIRIFRLKNLWWDLLRKDWGGRIARMPKLMQILEDGAEYILKITGQKRKRPNAPGTSKRQHFERANQKKKLKKKDFSWSPSGTDDSQKAEPRSLVARRSEVGYQTQESLNRDFSEPHVEPPSEPPKPEEPLLSPRERKEQKKRIHQAKLEEQKRRNEEARREEEAIKKKREDDAEMRRWRRE